MSTNRTTKTYYGLAGTTFKKRYGGHRSNLENREDYGTALSKYVWFLRDNNVTFDLKWSIKKKAQVYSAGAKYCDLWLTEKTIKIACIICFCAAFEKMKQAIAC